MEFVILLIVAIVVIIQHERHKNDPLKREIQFYKNEIEYYKKKIIEYEELIGYCETSNSGLLSSSYFKESRIRSLHESIEGAQEYIERNKERLQEKQKELNKLEGRREDDNGKEDKGN